MELLITTKKRHPLLGLDWMGELLITLKSEKLNPNINHINKTGNTADYDITTLKRKFHNLFNENHTTNNVKVDIQLKEEAKLMQQKGSRKRDQKVEKPRAYQKSKQHRRNLRRKPGSNYHQKNKSVRTALDLRKLNEITVKRKAQMPNIEKLVSKLSRKVSDGPADEIWISKFVLDYAYGQLHLSKRAMDLRIFAVTGGNFTGYYRFLKGLYRLADIPTTFQEKIFQQG